MIIFAGLLVLAAIVLPQLWVRHTLARHAAPRPDLPGTGGELARHLVERFDLEGVTVEPTDLPDHYDPDARAVRLSHQHFSGRAISAVAVAAHEVGHAIQHANGERKLELRQKLARLTVHSDRLAGIFFIAAPVLGLLVRTPLAFAALIGLGVGLLAVRVVVNVVTLPVEHDASFAKALPVLEEGGYLSENDLPAARSVLRAAAMTYVAGALMSLVNLARWVRLLR